MIFVRWGGLRKPKAFPVTTILDGFYKDGKIELTQPPVGLSAGRVRVLVIADEPAHVPPRLIQFGKYPGDNSTLEDFEGSQWRSERDPG